MKFQGRFEVRTGGRVYTASNILVHEGMFRLFTPKFLQLGWVDSAGGGTYAATDVWADKWTWTGWQASPGPSRFAYALNNIGLVNRATDLTFGASSATMVITSLYTNPITRENSFNARGMFIMQNSDAGSSFDRLFCVADFDGGGTLNFVGGDDLTASYTITATR